MSWLFGFYASVHISGLGCSPIFQPVQSYPSGGWTALANVLADVNGDNILDLVVINQCPASDTCAAGGVVGVLLGKNDGTFQPVKTYPSGGYLYASTAGAVLAVADVNGDGIPDVLVANACSTGDTCTAGGVIGVLLGIGDGTFKPAQTYASGGVIPNAIAVQDVNGDGKPDLLVANYCGTLSGCNGILGVLLGVGDGTFKPVQTYLTGGSAAISIAVGDVNHDGHPDVIVGHSDVRFPRRSTLSVMLNNGDGTFQTAQTCDSGGWGVSSIAVQDINGDNNPDILLVTTGASVNDYYHSMLNVMFGDGKGFFSAPRKTTTGGGAASALALADVNRNGMLDALIFDTRGFSAWSGNGNGTFLLPARSAATGFSHTIAVADLNGDTRPDVAIAEKCFPDDCSQGGVGVLLNAVPFTTTTIVTSSLNPAAYGQTVILTATVGAEGPLVPTGTINFQNGTKWLGRVTLNNGVATLAKSKLPVGTLSITARYNADPNFVKSTSPALIQVIDPVSTPAKP